MRAKPTSEHWQTALANAGLVHKVALSIQRISEIPSGNRDQGLDDLLQESFIAAAYASLGFKPERGWELSTYTARTVRNELNAFRKGNVLLRIPWSAHKKARENDGIHPRTGKPLPRITSVGRIPESTVEYNGCRQSGGLDAVAPEEPDPLVAAEDKAEHARQLELLPLLLDQMDPEDARLLRQRFGIGTAKLSHRRIAAVDGVSYECVRSRERRALARLKVMMEDKIKCGALDSD